MWSCHSCHGFYVVFFDVLMDQADMELKEVTHCRLAMLAFSGMVTQAVLTNSGFPYTG